MTLSRKWCGDTHTQVPSQRRQRAGGEGATAAAATAGATVSAAATEARLRETPYSRQPVARSGLVMLARRPGQPRQ